MNDSEVKQLGAKIIAALKPAIQTLSDQVALKSIGARRTHFVTKREFNNLMTLRRGFLTQPNGKSHDELEFL